MDDLLKKVHQFILEQQMLQQHMHVVAGVSGGADSMCLLFVLLSLKTKLDLKITAVHINHGLRGADADRDEAFVKSWCEEFHVPCVSFKTDIRTRAQKLGISEEECGRDFRYECFERVCHEMSADVIAVAHHMDDLAETVVFNMVRGSQIKGLAGIMPVRGKIIRPLLCLRRYEIEALLKSQRIDYCMDETNFHDAYTRNKIRLRVLPYLTQQINPRAVEHIASAASAALELSEYVARQTQIAWGKVAVTILGPKSGVECDALCVEALHQEDIVIQRALIRCLIEKKTGKLKNITALHVEDIRALIKRCDGKRIDLPYGMTAIRSGKYIVLEERSKIKMSECNKEVPLCIPVTVPGICRFNGIDGTYALECIKTEQIPLNFKNDCTKCFDYDKINDGLLLRHRQPGDYMEIKDGMKKTVARIMIDAKIPKEQREKLYVLADGSHVLWIPQMKDGRISEHYKLGKMTKQVLTIKLKGVEKDGR